MLDTLMKVGAYRVDHFEFGAETSHAFGFYVRGEKTVEDVYSHDAKYQLYAGLVLIEAKHEMNQLRGIYIDVDSLENIHRPAYLQLKRDLVNGLFRRVFVPVETALLGSPLADRDLMNLYHAVGGFELLVCRGGDCIPIDLANLENAEA